MQILDAYLLATKVEKIPENPDSGMVKKDGLYYPSWATDYLLVSAQAVSNSGTNFELHGSTAGLTKYGVEVAAGQESGGYCLIYTAGSWTSIMQAEYARRGVQIGTAQIFTFPSLQKMKMALLTGQMGESVWHSGSSNLILYSCTMVSRTQYPYFGGIDGIYQIVAIARDGDIVDTIATRNLGTYYASQGWNVRHESVSGGLELRTILASRSFT